MTDEQTSITTPTPRSLSAVALSALEIFLKVFAIGVPVLYLLGRVYMEGYWGHVNLSPTLMDYAAEDYIYFGFAVALNKILSGINGIPGGAVGGLVVVAAVLALITTLIVVVRRWALPLLGQKILLAERRMRAWRANEQGLLLQLARPFAAMLLASYTLLFYFFLIIFIAALPILIALEEGKAAAQKDRNRLSQASSIASEARALVHLNKLNGPDELGVLLSCSPEWCVMLERGDFIAVPKSDVLRIDHCPRTIMLQNKALICKAEVSISP